MAMKSIDFKEIGMKHGERIGLAVGLLFMLFLMFRAFMLEGSTVTPEKVKRDESTATSRVESAAVDPAKLVPVGTISPTAINDLAQTVMRSIGRGAHSFLFSNMMNHQQEDIFRNKPNV